MPRDSDELGCVGWQRRMNETLRVGVFAWRASALAAVLVAAGCGTLNYPGLEGPLYEGGLGRAPAERGSLRIVTYNIEFAKRVELAIEQLRRSPLAGADVLALQEMDAPGVQRIASALGMRYVYYPGSLHPRTKREFGSAILSPWPIEAPRKLVLPHPSRIVNQIRTVAVATVRVGGLPLLVYSIHLGSPVGTSGGKRRSQMEVILQDAAASSAPAVILGDFNSKDVARQVELRGYAWLTRDVGPTLERFGRSFEYDHILIRGLPAHARAFAGVARDGPRASDHWPVWAMLLLEAPGP